MENMLEEQIVNEDLNELIRQMLLQIGSTDSELRDKLIYSTFVKLIKGNYLDAQQLRHIIQTCLDQHHLFYQLGETNSDSVFTRSFSSLIIAAILEKDADTKFLSDDIYLRVFICSHTYLRQESDTRGYVEEKGWAHSIAHGADLLVSAVEHPNYKKEIFQEYLATIQACLFKGEVYTDNEDERLINVIESLVKKDLSEVELETWVTNLFTELKILFEKEADSLYFYRTKVNISNFAKSLYFRLGYGNIFENVREVLKINLEVCHKDFTNN